MKYKYLQHLAYYLYWIFFFVGCKAVFLVYHHTKTAYLTASETANVFLHGLYLDASFSAYICVLPFFLFLIQTLFKNFRSEKLISIYTILLVVIISFITTADLELYNAWGFRLDTTPLQYFNNPKEMSASVSILAGCIAYCNFHFFMRCIYLDVLKCF